jgi:hypothetical protein
MFRDFYQYFSRTEAGPTRLLPATAWGHLYPYLSPSLPKPVSVFLFLVRIGKLPES